jgi:hypothetical protein
MAAPERKPVFAPIPARAIGDERLSALDLRVMMAIAVHDRMSKNGVGCTAGHGRLAGLVGCHLKSLSRSIRTLAECSYVGARANPLNPRSRSYFVIYNEFDNTYLNAAKGNEAVTYPEPTDEPIGNQVATPQVTNSFQIGNQLSENAQSDQGDSVYNIFSEAERNPVETVIRNPVETAPISQNKKKRAWEGEASKRVGADLATLERGMKDGKYDLESSRQFLAGLFTTLSYDDPNYHWALRLLERVEASA